MKGKKYKDQQVKPESPSFSATTIVTGSKSRRLFNMILDGATTLLVLSSLAHQALCHSFLEKITANGKTYAAWNPNDWKQFGTPYPSNTPSWYTENFGGNPLYPSDILTRNITCAKNVRTPHLKGSRQPPFPAIALILL
jgi:hypothetical protein